MRQRHRFEAEDLARALLATVCRAVRPPAQLISSDPRCRLRHAAVIASLRLSERGGRVQQDSIPYLERSLEALGEIPQHVAACREAGHLDAKVASELMGVRDRAVRALALSLSAMSAV